MLSWCDVAGVVGDAAMDALMVEPIDIRHRGELDIFEASPGALTVDEFPFVETVEGLDQRVVVAISFRSDRGDDVVVGEPLGIGDRQILSGVPPLVGTTQRPDRPAPILAGMILSRCPKS